jgi:hypothetical protein
MIHDLVSEGRATPEQGALLIEFRRELEAGRERQFRKSSPWAFVMAIGTFVLVLLGVRSNSSS